MKYTCEITVKLPLEAFIKKFNNADNMKHWQKGLESYEHISGTPGYVGSKMNLSYNMGNRSMQLVETITKNELPYELHMTYDTKGLHNIQENSFVQTPEGHTKWTSYNEFIPTSFMLRMMTLLMPGVFKKQSMTYLKDFKKFAEQNTSVSHA
jgi:hypothetical protein